MSDGARLHWIRPDVTAQPETASQRWPLGPSGAIIGRQPPAEIVIPLPNISRRHAAVEPTQWGYAIRDLGSRNGTFVNGDEVEQDAVELMSNDQIVLGGQVTLLFTDPEETPHTQRLGRLHGIWIDPKTQVVWIDALSVNPPLSSAQLSLLKLLYSADGRAVNRDEIIAAVWPDVEPDGVSEDAVDSLIKRLRRRLRETQPDVEYVQVVRGYGLRLVNGS